MSDDDDFMLSADEDDYNFDYDDDDGDDNDDAMDTGEGDSTEMDMENKYYNAKAEKEDDTELAIQLFKEIIESEPTGSERAFKASKQLIKTLFLVGKKQELIQLYESLFDQIAVLELTNKTYMEKSLSNLLDHLNCSDSQFMESLFSCTLQGLKKLQNERMIVRTYLRLAKWYIDHDEVHKSDPILTELENLLEPNRSKSTAASASALAITASDKSTSTLEFYALQIQAGTMENNKRKVALYHEKAQKAQTSGIPHPRILGVIRECGGKMHMREKKWAEAREDFFESFKNYDEAGSQARLPVLRYYVLACMLSESGINPFDSQETKPYREDAQVIGVVKLVDAFQRSDIDTFEEVMKDHKESIAGDRFIEEFLDELIRSLRSLSLLSYVKPYSRVYLSKIAELLSGISLEEVQGILTSLILDMRLPNAKIDFANGILIVDSGAAIQKTEDNDQLKLTKFLPSRYSENARGQKQQVEQQILVTSANEDVSKMSSASRIMMEDERYSGLTRWTNAIRSLSKNVKTR